MKRNSNGARDVRGIIIFLSLVFVAVIIDYRSFLAKSRDEMMYDEFNGHLSSVRVSITKLEYLLDMFVVAGRFESATVDIIKDDVANIDREINDGLLNPKYGTILTSNALLSDGIGSIADDWQTIKIEIRRLNGASSPDEIRLIHDAVDMNTVSLIDKAEKLISVTADGRSRVFHGARTQALASIIVFTVIALGAGLYVFYVYLSPLKRAAALAASASSGAGFVKFDEQGGCMGRLAEAHNGMMSNAAAALSAKDELALAQGRAIEEGINQLESINGLLRLAGGSLSENEIFRSVVREAAAVGGADAAAVYLRDEAGFRLAAATGFPDGFSSAVFSMPGMTEGTHPAPGEMGEMEAIARAPASGLTDGDYGRFLKGLGYAALSAYPVGFNDKPRGVLVAAWKDARRCADAPRQFFEALASAAGSASGHIALFQSELSERRFVERVLNQLPSGVAVFDRGGACRLCNGQFRRLMGSGARCEYSLFDDKSLVDNGAVDALKRSYDGYSAEVTVNYDPTALLVKYGFTGSPRMLRIKSSPVYGADGEISNICLIYEDLADNAARHSGGAQKGA
ncbi:MAG: PAS domain-containing protein [Deltaproteobacteria bacterium]|nr:PAS domain-containing protein [Deltaproteobacteria bacterium]